MITANDAVMHKPVFEKVANATLTGDITKWHETILQKFFEEVDFLPPNVGVDVVISSVDTNKGYGKGSVVVWFKDKKVNFPVIVKDFELSPFDVLVYDVDGEQVYLPANFDNVKKIISTETMGTLENIWDKGNPQYNNIKTPGGVYPKQQIPVSEQPADVVYPPFAKMSGWRKYASKEDLLKFAGLMERDPALKANYVDNTGDLITNIIDLAHSQEQVIADTDKEKDINLNGIVEAKQAVTAIDAELFDVNQLQPVMPPAVCELRLYEYPSMEDFIESGDGMLDRFMATKNGRPIAGIVVDVKEGADLMSDCATGISSGYNSSDPIEKAKQLRQRRDQIFVSLDGSCYSVFKDYNKTGIGFYGSKIMQMGKGAVEKVLNIIDNNTSDDFISSSGNNRGDGSDKLFNPINQMEQGQSDYNYAYPASSGYDTNLVVIYGANDSFECITFRGNYRKIKVNGANVYTSRDCAIIPANVASAQKVRSVKSKVYQMAILGAKNIYLVPETSVIFNTEYMRMRESGDFMRPNLPVQKVFEDANISKTAVEIDCDNGGYRISGKPFEGLKKIAGDRCFSTKEAIRALSIMGMKKESAELALKHTINRYVDKTSADNKVYIYGLRGDYINENFKLEKHASHKEVFQKIASILRKDLVKEASAISDPDAVDVVLSLNFVNSDSLKGFIDNIGEMRRILSELSKMLIASRLGLSDMDESALKKSMEGLGEVINGLENIKLAIQ